MVQVGLKNGGAIEFNNQTYPVNYVAIEDEDEIKAVTDAYKAKYHGQYPIDMMVSDKCATAIIRFDPSGSGSFKKTNSPKTH